MEINREDAELMDAYLKAIAENKKIGMSFTHRGLMNTLNVDLKHVDYLTRKIIAFSKNIEEVAKPLNESGNYASIESIYNTEPFLNRGGFVGYVNIREEEIKIKKEKEDIEYKKLKRDYKWDLWIKAAAIIGGLLGIFNFLKDMFF